MFHFGSFVLHDKQNYVSSKVLYALQVLKDLSLHLHTKLYLYYSAYLYELYMLLDLFLKLLCFDELSLAFFYFFPLALQGPRGVMIQYNMTKQTNK